MERGERTTFLPALCHFCRIDSPQPDHARGYLVALQSEAAKVLATHNRRSLDNVLRSNGTANCAGNALDQLRIIIGRWRDFGIADLYYRSKPIRYSRCRRGSLSDPFDRGENHLANLFPIGADCKLQVHFVRNYVVPGAAVYRTDRNHCRVQW